MAEEKKLNKEQLAAIRYGKGPLLIIAGAGTGKTTVVTERIKYLIGQRGISPGEILALTFTEKAAREMEIRVDEALPLGYANLWISTFHSFGDRILRDEAVNIGLDPRYHLLTEAEVVQFLRRHLFQFNLDYYRPLGNPNKFVADLLQHFSRLKDEDISPSDYLAWAKTQNPKSKYQNQDEKDETKRWNELAKAYRQYEELKVREGSMDFADLISNLLKLLRQRPRILANYQARFKHILVDEFQDTNYAQNQLLLLLAGDQPELTVVADDDQAIFRWRGAAISNVVQFTQHFPQTKVVVLTQNYRSSQTILAAAYRLIQNNNPDRLEVQEKINKKLTVARSEPSTESPIEFCWTDRAESEADWVVQRISELTTDYSQYSDIAILVRANNHAEPFIRALSRAGIPYQFLGPGQLFRQPEVKDLIAYLTVLNNFEDSVAMYRLLILDLWGLSGRELAAMINFGRKNKLSLFETAERVEQVVVPQESRDTIRKIVAMIHRHLDLAKNETAGQILYYFLQDSGLLKRLTNYTSARDEVRAQNVAKFFDRLKAYESSHEDGSVDAVMDFINLSMELGDSPLASEVDWTGDNAVSLLTVHSAKGLEFPVVFLVNLVSQRFPTIERREQIPIPGPLIKEILPTGDSHLQEERRLFYVGVTRAKDQLFLTGAKYYGEGRREKKVSPFVVELLGEKAVCNAQNARREQSQLSFLDFRPSEVPPTIDRPTSQLLDFLSYSQITTFATCPLQYRYRYVLRIPTPPSAALAFGEVIHQTMRDFYQRVVADQAPTKEDLLRILEENWSPVGYTSQALEEKYRKEGTKILGEYYEKCFLSEKQKPVALEQKFTLKISPQLTLGGKIDRIDQTAEGVEIIDYKTGRSPAKKEVDKDWQLTLYALAATDGTLTYLGLLERTPRPEEVKVSFYFFDGQEKVTAVKKAEDFSQLKTEIVTKAQAILQSTFAPTPGRHCDFCQFRLICEAWS